MSDVERAYIAGFLDGDGSIILQIVRRHDYKLGFQIRASVCFYQKRCGAAVLEWIRARIGVGSIRDRGVMSDYTVVGFASVRSVLNLVAPYVVVKRSQVDAALRIIADAEKITQHSELLAVAMAVDRYSTLNYSKRRTVTAEQVARGIQSRVASPNRGNELTGYSHRFCKVRTHKKRYSKSDEERVQNDF